MLRAEAPDGAQLVPLVAHSAYSLCWGVSMPEQLVSEASRAGYGALALTDRNSLYGLPVFLEACRNAGVRPVIGVEFTMGWGCVSSGHAEKHETGRVIAIARNRSGFSTLCRILSERARVLNEGGLPASTWAVPPRSRLQDAADARKVLGRAEAVVREALLECAGRPDGHDLFLLSDSIEFLQKLKPGRTWADASVFGLCTGAHRERWQKLASTRHPLVASPEFNLLDGPDVDAKNIQRLLIAIGLGWTVDEVAPELCAPVAETLRARYYPEWIQANARIVAESLADPFNGLVFPSWKPNRSAAHVAQPTTTPQLTAAAELRRLAFEGIRRRYGVLSDTVRSRVEYELSIIEQKGFSDYFLVVHDIARLTKRICGRGSAAASIISYALGITDVDPVAHNLYFERFLNPGRQDPPDIDIDFAWDERDGILEQTVAMFGPEHCARVANHNCFRFRGALRDTARAFGIPDEETSAMELRLEQDREAALAAADQIWKKILAMADRVTGLPRNLGTHSGGIIIVPGRIDEYVPIEKTGSGILVTAWDKDGVEAAGLVKIDLLGNRSLAVVRDTLADLEEQGIALDQARWHPEKDPDTVAMIARGDTMGVFYVESPAMCLLQKKTGVGDFAHLVIHSSIIRPAANRFIEEYIERLKGKPWRPLHPALGELFAETYGIMCYQEDVSKAAQALAGFSSSDADAIRKVLSKKDRGHRLEMWKNRFFDGCRAHGIAEDIISQVWDMIMSFSGYSFVKAHSASYAMLSFQSAWLRAHHPAAFMAAVISNRGGFYSTLAYASEARRMGLRLLPPDVNESQIRCRGQGTEIRWGLGMIAGLRASTPAAIVAAREHGGHQHPHRFLSLEDFAARVSFARSEAEALVGSGALDGVARGMNRSAMLMTLLKACARRSEHPETSLFNEAAEPAGEYSASGDFADVCTHQPSDLRHARRVALAQLKWLGTTLEIHPLHLVPGALSSPRIRARDISRHIGCSVRLSGWLITAKEVLTRQEEPMEFITFEDETARFETVLFPEAFRRYRPALLQGGAFLVEGRVEESHRAVTLAIERLTPYPRIPELPSESNKSASFIRAGRW